MATWLLICCAINQALNHLASFPSQSQSMVTFPDAACFDEQKDYACILYSSLYGHVHVHAFMHACVIIATFHKKVLFSVILVCAYDFIHSLS